MVMEISTQVLNLKNDSNIIHDDDIFTNIVDEYCFCNDTNYKTNLAVMIMKVALIQLLLLQLMLLLFQQ